MTERLRITLAVIVILLAAVYAGVSRAEEPTVCGMWATDIDFVGGGVDVEYTASIWCGEFLNNDINVVQPCAFVDYRGVTYPSHSGCQPVPEPGFTVALMFGVAWLVGWEGRSPRISASRSDLN